MTSHIADEDEGTHRHRNVTTTKISCHEKVADSLQRVLSAVAAKYTQDQIEDLGLNIYGGCFNKRKKR